MATTFTKNTFGVTYKDDFADSDNYHRILFNSGRAVQARELTQSQTITQEEIARLGRHVFKDGAAVNPGGPTIDNSYEFVKLSSTITDDQVTSLVGLEFTGATSSVKARVIRVAQAVTDTSLAELSASVSATGDPATIFVQYTDTSTSGLSGTTPVRFTPGENITSGSTTLTVQSTNTTANPATGQGTLISNGAGDFFVRGHFVFTKAQSTLLRKYSKFPTEVVGFVVTEDIVTFADDTALYDNQGAAPNTTAPGADRYRISLTLTRKSDVTGTQNFVFYADIVAGEIVEQVTGTDNYNKINEVLALRTREESGNYIVNPFRLSLEADSASASSNLVANVSSGTAYVNGYRFNKEKPTKLIIPKPRTTTTVNNETVGINYGSFVVCDTIEGLIPVNGTRVNISTSTTNPGASIIGTVRVRSIAKDGINFRAYLYDIQMSSGQNFRNAKTIGSGTTDFLKIKLESSKAILKEGSNSAIVFPAPNVRPKTLSDINFEVQRVFAGTVSGGSVTLTALSGETFVNTSDWIVTTDSSGDQVASPTFGSVGSQSLTLSAMPDGPHTIYAKVNKSAGTSRTKTLAESTVTRATITNGIADGTAGQLTYVKLDHPDIFTIEEIKDGSSSGADISANFDLDNGQRPAFYQTGRIILKQSATAPSGNVYVKYKHFTHGATGDFFSVNSYTGQVEYENILDYRPDQRTIVNLRDVVDFRGIKASDSGSSEGAFTHTHDLPSTGDIVNTDIEYYLPRADRIVANIDGSLQLISGQPGFSRQLPPVPENTLNLFNLNLNGYGISDSDASLKTLKFKRFRMQDIARLEERVDGLEETTALSFLEQATEQLLITDSSGTARTKSGFLVDNFNDRGLSDAQDPDYRASVDPSTSTLHPHVSVQNIPLIYDSSKSTNTILKGDNVYLSHTEDSAITQTLISGTENINPFAVITQEGQIRLSPASDIWTDTKYDPAKVVNAEATIDLGDVNGMGNQNAQALRMIWNRVRLNNFPDVPDNLDMTNWFGNWVWNWTGIENAETTNVTEQFSAAESRRLGGGGRLLRTTDTFSQRQVVGSSTITEIIGDRTVSLTFIPFMRPRLVFFRAEGLRPTTRYYPFFDGVGFDNFVKSETFKDVSGQTYTGNQYQNLNAHPSTASTLTTDAAGKVEGSFLIPSSDTNKFRVGEREFKLLDISVDDEPSSTSHASTIFTSKGTLDTRQETIRNTRLTVTATRRWEDVTWHDPLAQSFMVTAPSGMFITKVQCYFASKDATIPVQLQIRPMVNGHPSASQIFPGSSVFVNPASVNTATGTQANALAAPTDFVFDEPIFLNADTEYAIVLLSDCTSYNAYVGKTYEFELGSTEKRINKQPSMGSLFKSQNGTTWEPDQTQDLAFKLFKAQFTTAGGTATFQNASVPKQKLISNPILTTASSKVINVLMPDHGLHVNDTVMIEGVSISAGQNGVDSSGTINQGSLHAKHTVTAIDGNGFQFNAPQSGNASASGFMGGDNVTCTKNIEFDCVVPTLDTLIPEDTTFNLGAKFTTGKSLAGSETRFVKDTAFSKDISIGKENFFTAPRMIAHDSDEDAELGVGTGHGNKSVEMQATIDTIRADVSPVIDTQRCAMTTIHNRIDKQASGSATGFNVPLFYVAETEPQGGSHISKHITRPITLLEDAINLKILFASLRPAEADFEVYFRTANEGVNIHEQPYTLSTLESPVSADKSNFLEYRYNAHPKELDAFNQYQIKIVFRSTNTSMPPLFKDLRVIAVST
jgi:hypothetical protein